ncbi:Uncharacterised protein [uncultured archaeon]|nr:Uncharacterised protein [uncultured archaeon]
MPQVSAEFTIELPNGKEFTFEAKATKTVDPAYGADADGRRGVRVEYLEDILFDEKAIVKAVREALHDTDWE